MSEKRYSPIISCRLAAELIELVDRIAKFEGVSRSHVARTALLRGLGMNGTDMRKQKDVADQRPLSIALFGGEASIPTWARVPPPPSSAKK
jgi:hypothetical protein